jgi:hypothetical protein
VKAGILDAFALGPISELAKENGFTVLGMRGANETHPFPDLLRPIAKLTILFASLGSRIVVAAAK